LPALLALFRAALAIAHAVRRALHALDRAGRSSREVSRFVPHVVLRVPTDIAALEDARPRRHRDGGRAVVAPRELRGVAPRGTLVL